MACARKSGQKHQESARVGEVGLGLVILPIFADFGTASATAALAASDSVMSLVASQLVEFVASGIINAFGAVLAVITYLDLRVAKEGVATETLARVFD
jgi:hypothetical protein